jgi:hypothetical protein
VSSIGYHTIVKHVNILCSTMDVAPTSQHATATNAHLLTWWRVVHGCCARTKIIQKLKICPLRPSTYFQRWVKSLYFAFTSVFEQLYYSVLLEIEPWMPPLCRLWCEEDVKLILSCVLINAVNYSLTFRETWIHTKRVLLVQNSSLRGLLLIRSLTSERLFVILAFLFKKRATSSETTRLF